jgi:hypothetical protein
MWFAKALGYIWLIAGLAWLARISGDNGLTQPAVWERGLPPEVLAQLVTAVAGGIVPALVLVALGLWRPRRRASRIFAHTRHGEHARHNEAEIERIRRGRRAAPHQADEGSNEHEAPARASLWNLPPSLKQARADYAAPSAAVTSDRPSPGRRSVVER